LIIKDGTYYQSLNVTVSGTLGSPITIQAENDGDVIIDGQNARYPLYIYEQSYITIEGIVLKNSHRDVVYVYGSSNITFRRVSASNVGTSGGNPNYHQFDIISSSYVTLEDCAAYGTGRNPFNIFESSFVTVRRCFVRWTYAPPQNSTYADGVVLYGSSNSIVENCVVSIVDSPSHNVGGIGTWQAPWTDTSTDDNNIYGNIVMNTPLYAFANASAIERITGNSFINNVVIDSSYGMREVGDFNATWQNNTIIDTASGRSMVYGYIVAPSSDEPKSSSFEINVALKNTSILSPDIGIVGSTSSYVNSFTHDYNNVYDADTPFYLTSQETREITSNPGYDTATYGKGAYLMIPSALQGQGEGGADIGAEVLNRYENGVLTSTPLWPWPMEERIFNETGISVTWEAKGGLWRTLDGVYDNVPINPPVVDSTSPSIPSGITAVSVSSSQVNFSWTASTDPSGSGQASGVAGYKVYRNGVQIATTSNTSYTDAGLSPSTTYTYSVSAYDGAGNVSAQSGPVSVTTQPAPESEPVIVSSNTNGNPMNPSTVFPLPRKSIDFLSYPPIALPHKSTNPYIAKPMGVGSVAAGGNSLNFQIGLYQFDDAGDIYLGVYAPAISPEIHIIKPDLTLQPISLGLVPWKANISGPISENLFSTISDLPPATYYLYMAVTNASSLDTYYLWSTYFIIQ
jgi:hypothetical protein